MLLDRGDLRRLDDGRFAIDDHLDTLAVPEHAPGADRGATRRAR